MSAGARRLAEGWPGWLDDTDALIGFLRARGFIMGTCEALRVLGLLERLQEGNAQFGKASPEEMAPWLAPVLCTNEAEQSALAPALAAYAATFRRHAREEEPRAQAVPAAPAPQLTSRGERWDAARRRRVVLAVAVGIVILATALAAIWWLSGRSGPLPNVQSTWSAVAPSGDMFAGGFPVLPSLIAAAILRAFGWFDVLRFAVPPFLIRLLYLRWRGRRRPVLRRLAAPATVQGRTIAVHSDAGASLFGDPDLAHAYQGLRAHRTFEGTRIDVRQTIHATIRAVGRLRHVNEQRPRLPDYPMVVEEMSSADHLATVARVLHDHLQRERVDTTLYAFAADLRRLRTSKVDRPVSLGELRLRHEAELLLLISDGEIFWDSLTGGLRRSAEQLLRSWERVVLLTPVPQHRWSWRERTLALAGVIVLPATKSGVQALGDFLRTGGEPAEANAGTGPGATKPACA